MNCHRAHQLVSPYLDHQLTGAEMLEIQRHLDGCRSCAEEYRAARDIKTLLRSLRVQEPVGPLETRISQRLGQQDRALWLTLPRLALPLATRPPGGRQRLGVALALSCVALFAITPSFAPPAADVAAARAPAPDGFEQTAFHEQAPDIGLRTSPVALSLLLARSSSAPDTTGASFSPAVWGMDPGPQDAPGASPYAPPPPLVDVGAEPLGDPAADGYVALADYRPR